MKIQENGGNIVCLGKCKKDSRKSPRVVLLKLDDRQTFTKYANYVIDLKERNGIKHTTIQFYRYLMERITPDGTDYSGDWTLKVKRNSSTVFECFL